MRLGVAADADAVAACSPDVVIVATGGEADGGDFPGSEHATSTWDVLSGRSDVGDHVLLFDDNGAEQALSCAEYIVERGGKVEFVTADSQPGVLLERTTRPTFLKNLYRKDVLFTPNHRLTEIYREGGRLVAVLRNDYTGQEEERVADQIVVEAGTVPNCALYSTLKPRSSNLGELDLEAFTTAKAQTLRRNPDGTFQLFRIGDAVASRNIHAAIFDAARLCKEL